MTLSRRTILKSTFVGTALAGFGISTRTDSPVSSLLIFDSRYALSRMFASYHGFVALDLAKEDDNLWRALRSSAPAGSIVGMTRWPELVISRSWFQAQKKRVRAEQKIGMQGLWLWEMA